MTKRGRPKGSKNTEKSDWKPFATRLSPECLEYLSEMKQRGFMIAKLVDNAIWADKIKREGKE